MTKRKQHAAGRGRLAARRAIEVLGAAMLLGSCGGGGGSGGSSGGGTAPTISFQSATTASVTENASGTIYTASASASNGQAVTFSISGGEDAAQFSIAQDGQLRFIQPPNYDLPTDADGDGVYRVSLTAGSGSGRAVQTLAVTVTNAREGIAVTRIAQGFVDPVGMAMGDGDRGLIVAERGGRVFAVNGADGALTLLHTVNWGSPAELIDVTFGRSNAYVQGAIVLLRRADSVIAAYADLWADVTLATGDSTGTEGTLFTSPEGVLYAAVGDPDGSRAQGDSGYGRFFVQGDPYAGASLRVLPLDAGGNGVRNPGGIAAIGDRLLLADRGASHEHEINLFLGNQRPINFGWPFRDGTARVSDGEPAGLIGPSLVYPVGDGTREGAGIVAGVAYGGPIASVKDHYVFGDIAGTIWSMPISLLTDGRLHGAGEIEDRTEDFTPDAGSIDEIVEIAADAAGNLYILDADGEIFRMDAA